MQDSEREELKGKVLPINDLVAYQTGTIASRMIVFKKSGTLAVFSFDEGEGLLEHTAPFDAILQVTEGEAEVQIASAPFTVHTGELIILPEQTACGFCKKAVQDDAYDDPRVMIHTPLGSFTDRTSVFGMP